MSTSPASTATSSASTDASTTQSSISSPEHILFSGNVTVHSDSQDSSDEEVLFDIYTDPFKSGLYQLCLINFEISHRNPQDVLEAKNCFQNLIKYVQSTQPIDIHSFHKICIGSSFNIWDYYTNSNPYILSDDPLDRPLPPVNTATSYLNSLLESPAELPDNIDDTQVVLDRSLTEFYEWTPLLLSIYVNSSSKVKNILSQDPKSIIRPIYTVNSPQYHKSIVPPPRSPLHYPITLAAILGFADIFKLLLNKGSTNTVDTKVTCLQNNLWHFAVQGGSVEIIDEILKLPSKEQPDITGLNRCKQNVLHIACQYSPLLFPKILKIVPENQLKVLVNALDVLNRLPLHYALINRNSSPETVGTLISLLETSSSRPHIVSIPVNTRDIFGLFPLQLAIQSHNVSAIEKLICRKASQIQQETDSKLFPKELFIIEFQKLKEMGRKPMDSDENDQTQETLRAMKKLKDIWNSLNPDGYNYPFPEIILLFKKLTPSLQLSELLEELKLLKNNNQWDLLAKEDYGNTILHEAIYKNCSLEIIRFLLHLYQYEFKDVDTVGFLRKTPLLLAAEQGRQDVIEYILQCRQTFEQPLENPSRPFHAFYSKFETLKSDVCQTDSLENNILHSLASHGSTTRDLFERIVKLSDIKLTTQNIFKRNPIYKSALSHNLPITRWILTSQPEMKNQQEENNGETLLHAYLSKKPADSCEMLNYLLEKTDNLSIRDNGGRLPIHIAAQYSNLESIKLLCQKYPGSVDEPDNYGWLPLWYALEKTRHQIVVFLARESIWLTHRDKFSRSVYHQIAMYANEPVYSELQKLYKPGLFSLPRSRDILDNKGRTPLHLAARHGNSFMTRTLIDAHASMEIKDNENCTPLQVAQNHKGMKGVKKVISIFEEEKTPPKTKSWDRGGNHNRQASSSSSSTSSNTHSNKVQTWRRGNPQK